MLFAALKIHLHVCMYFEMHSIKISGRNSQTHVNITNNIGRDCRVDTNVDGDKVTIED